MPASARHRTEVTSQMKSKFKGPSSEAWPKWSKRIVLGALFLVFSSPCWAQAPGFAESLAQPATLDSYGGDAVNPCVGKATGYFFTEQDPQDHNWWFCDPAGNHFYLNGVEVVGAGDATGYGPIMTA